MNFKDIIAVTNRKIAYEHIRNNMPKDYNEILLRISADVDTDKECAALLYQLEKLCNKDVRAIILREKDLPEEEYERLSIRVNELCKYYGKTLYIHFYTEVAKKLGCAVQLPLERAISYAATKVKTKNNGSDVIFGVSIHSVEDAKKAYEIGASFLVYGNVYETDCKKGLPGRGIESLAKVCESVPIPVYAIGGVDENNLSKVMGAGAKGGCMMSGAMMINA